MYKLLHTHLVQNLRDTRIKKALKNAILSDLQHRYIGETLLFLSKATFLDPKFKMLNFITTDEREAVVKEIKEEATAATESIAAEVDTSSYSTGVEPSN